MRRRAFVGCGGLTLAAALSGCGRSVLAEPEESLAPALAGGTLQFATGVENSSPRLPNGRRVDELEKCDHYRRWAEDFGFLLELGISALRYGPPLHRTLPVPASYDWSCVDDQMAWLRTSGVTVIADLCHFGVPDWLSGFDDPGLPAQLAAYAGAFARRYPWVRHYTPVNEIYIAALFSSFYGWWNEARRCEAAFVRTVVNVCRAHELAVEAILRERPDAIIVQSESIERYTPADGSPGAVAAAARWNELRCLSLDLTLGRRPSATLLGALAGAGVAAGDLEVFAARRAAGQRWLGADYYATCEQMVRENGSRTAAPRRVGLAAVARSYYERYAVPLYLTETNRNDGRAVEWLNEQWSEVLLLRATGVPVYGFTWYGLTDFVDWNHLLRRERGDVNPVGLLTLGRTVRRVGEAYASLISRWQPALLAGTGKTDRVA